METLKSINSSNNNESSQLKDKNQNESINDIFKTDEKTNNSSNSSFLENLELLEFISTGKCSKVYKSTIGPNKRIVAIKMLDTKNVNEINISKKLKNKNINNYYSSYVDEKNKTFNIIMDYAKLGNLRDFQFKFLEKNYLSETLLSFITYQILSGLKYIHKSKIAHFDIKPQNIVLDEYLNVKIIDFSISIDYNKIKSKTIKLPIAGTSFYMPPEVLRSDIINTNDLNKVDLYSLGVVLFCAAFGNFPYGLTQEDAKNYIIINEKIEKNKLVIDNEDNYYSSHFISFLKMLLEKDINKRINLDEALNNYWVKSAEILFDEKEKMYNAGKFLGYLVTDHFKNFDDYIKKGNLLFRTKK